jgi:DNA-binding response OmpR family regulator
METDSILIADPDAALLDNLSFFISSDLPGVELTGCTSVQQTVEQLSRCNYSTVIAAARLIQDNASSILHQKWKRHALVPFILTGGREDCESARVDLRHRGVFDVIAKPVDPTEALASIRLALWQARFLRLLIQPDCEVSQFQRHLAAYPHARDRGGTRGWVSKRVDDARTLLHRARNGNDLHRLNILLLNLAGSIEEWTQEQALDRLERMRVHHA